MSKPFKRKTVFIKKGFQIRFIIWVIALLIICGICSAAVLYPFLSSEMTNSLSSGHRDIGDMKKHLAIAIIIGNVLAIVIAGLATTVIILYITHKIAGPLYRLEQTCKEIGRGNLDAYAGLRDKDQLEGLSEAFTKMLKQLRERRGDQHKRLEMARRDLNTLQESLSDPSKSKELVKSIDKLLASLTEEMKGTNRST